MASGVVYGIEEIDEPLYTMLKTAGIEQVTHEDYNVLAVTDMETTQQYLDAMTSDPETYSWENIMYTLRSATEEGGAEGEAEAEAVEYVEGAEEEYANYLVQEVEGEGQEGQEEYQYVEGETYEVAEGEEYEYAEEAYTYEEEVVDAAAEEVAAEEEEPTEGGLDAGVEEVPEAPEEAKEEKDDKPAPSKMGEEITIKSDELGPKSGALVARFKVVKYNSEGGLLSGKKDKFFEIDFFAKEFRNLNSNGALATTYEAKDLYRVERHPTEPTHLKLLFFKHPNPVDLIFASCTARQRFLELCVLQRKNPVVWVPTLSSKQTQNEHPITIEGTTLNRNGSLVPTKPGATGAFVASKLPYEVLRIWTGSYGLQFKSLPPADDKLRRFMPSSYDAYIIGLQEIPLSMRDGRQIQEFFTEFFGSQFYVLLNTASDLNVYAGIESYRGERGTMAAVLIVVRRNFLPKVSSVDYFNLYEGGAAAKKHRDSADAYGVYATFKVQDSSIAVMLANLSKTLPDVTERNEKLLEMFNKVKCGDPMVDISARHDYWFMLGNLGYQAKPVDELHQQISGQVVLTEFQEAPQLKGRRVDNRVLFWHRQRSARAVSLHYAHWSQLPCPNVNAVFDIFVLRPYCYALCNASQPMVIKMKEIVFDCDTLQNTSSMEVRISGDWLESGVVTRPLKNRSAKLYTSDIPTLRPVCPAFEFLRAQALVVSLIGVADGLTKKKGELLATATVPLRDILSADTAQMYSAFVQRQGTVIGIVEASMEITAGAGAVGSPTK